MSKLVYFKIQFAKSPLYYLRKIKKTNLRGHDEKIVDEGIYVFLEKLN